MESTEVLKFLLPKEILSYFDIIRIKDDEVQERMDIYLDEKKIIPEEIENKKVQSYGFTSEHVIQDFPIRGRGVFFHIRRRKWLDVDNGQIFSKSFDFAYKGTQLTKEFVAFLKETN